MEISPLGVILIELEVFTGKMQNEYISPINKRNQPS